MNNKIIECRNKDASLLYPENYIEGQWTTKLQEKVILEDGDSILINSSFIDTEASSNQKINIENDLELTLHAIKYNIFNRGTKNASTSYFVKDGDDFDDKLDFEPYFLTNDIVGDTTNLRNLATVTGHLDGGSADTRIWGGATITIQYTDAKGNLRTTARQTATANWNGGNPPATKSVTSGIGLIFDVTKPISIISPTAKQMRDDNAERISFDAYQPVETGTLQMDEQAQKVLLPAGNYNPNEICSTINRQLQKNYGLQNASGAQGNNLIPVTSAFLTETSNYGDDVPQKPLVKDDGSYIIYTYDPADPTSAGNNLWCGASNMELAFNDAQSVFLWNYIHTPFYYTGGTEEAVEAVGITVFDKTDGTPRRALTNKSGGICFTHLNAVEVSSGLEVPFWNDTLGFDDSLLVSYQYKDIPAELGIVGQLPYITSGKLVDGVNITGNFNGLDTLIQKNNNFFLVPPLTDSNSSFYATSENTIPINAPNSALNAVYAFGYYLIEVNSKFLGDFLTPDNNHRNIKSIVSRYYEQNSYTSGSSGAVYTHKGAPLILESFGIRILESDKTLATNIGIDNTVFLEIVKGNQQPQPEFKKKN